MSPRRGCGLWGGSVSFAAVHIPEFPVAAWLQSAPYLKARPLVLLRGTPPQESVASLDAIALASGIEHGMSKVQAEAACAACFRSLEAAEEARAYEKVLALSDRFSPRVQAISSPANNYAGQDRLAVALLIDRSGTGSLFGTAQDYARRLHRALFEHGFESSVATAHNAEAALMLSRSQHGIVCVDESKLQAHLAPLPTALLQCEPTTQALLRRWGVRTLGQVAALPETGLISRLGQQGQRLQQLARGEAPHLLTPEQPEFSLSESLELDTPVEDLERLLFALSRLVGEIIRKAIDHAYAVRCLTATLALDRGQTHIVRVAPSSPTQNRENLLKLLNLELQAHPPQAEVIALWLEADATRPQIAQRGLFQSQFPDPDRLDLLLARLRSIAGEHNVGSATLAKSHREDAFTLEAFRPELDNSKERQGVSTRPALRALRPSQSIRVWLANERPNIVFWRGTKFKVADAAGPWHASGSWWDRTSFDCDFWDVVTEEPAYMLRLQQEHTSQAWSVLGLYD